MRKVILKNFLSPGDIVMLTATVRDLHLTHPKQFLTDVRTPCSPLWENNPYLTRLEEKDSRARVLDCQYPLIHCSNTHPWHFIHGFTQYVSEKLGVPIRPGPFKGDIHLSAQEKGWISQVQEITKEPVPFWIVVAGGKRDFTIKWWQHERFQKVVDHFQGKILFVQVGEKGHEHPPLKGTLDLRGKTNLRQLVRLVYHAQGVLCPVTLMMHLAAAVETKPGMPKSRPCVVVAGGREPAQWEAYPHHQYIHTNGALRCCDNGGCWKSRAVPLGDGDEKDKPGNICVDMVKAGNGNGMSEAGNAQSPTKNALAYPREEWPGLLPHCMDLITAEEVIRRIEVYFSGGSIKYLKNQTKVEIATNSATKPVKPGSYAWASSHGTFSIEKYYKLHFHNLYQREIKSEKDLQRRLQDCPFQPEIMLMGNFAISRDSIVSLCRQAGINVVHGEDGFFPHYSTMHADPLGFCWESSLPRMVFRTCSDKQRRRAQEVRGKRQVVPAQGLPSEIKKPFVFWPLQLLGDMVNRWDLRVQDWTGLVRHFRKLLPREFQLVIKEHPGSREETDNRGIAELARELPNTILVPRQTNLGALLLNCNAVAGANSTVLYEARLIFQKPAYVYARSWFTNHEELFVPLSLYYERELKNGECVGDNSLMRTERLDDYADWFLAQLLARQIDRSVAQSNPAMFKQRVLRLSYHSFLEHGEDIFE